MNPIPLPTSPLKGEEATDVPLKGEEAIRKFP
jgi:hypothetical protein